jgi:predicted RNase H-like HicB family nuclease
VVARPRAELNLSGYCGLISGKAIGRTPPRAYNVAVRNLTLPIVVEADSDGYFVSCPALQGCYSQGDSYEEAVENIKDAIRLHIEDRLASGEEVPEKVSVSLSTVEVTV